MQIAQALAKNSEMMMSLAESHDDKLKRTDEEAAEQEKMLAKLGACAAHRPASLNAFPVATLCATSRPLTRSPPRIVQASDRCPRKT